MSLLRAAVSALLVVLLFLAAFDRSHSGSPENPFCSPPKDPKSERFYGQTDGGLPFDRIVYERYFNGSCYGTFVDVGANDTAEQEGAPVEIVAGIAVARLGPCA